MARTVVIEESTITSMTKDPRFLQAFPFLNTVSAALRQSGGCCGKKNVANNAKATAFTNAKAAFTNLTPDGKQTLKNLLGATTVKIYVKEASTGQFKPVEL